MINRKFLISIVIGICFMGIVDMYILWGEGYLSVDTANTISKIYFIPFVIGCWLSGNVHKPSIFGFNLVLFLIGFMASFLVLTIFRALLRNK